MTYRFLQLVSQGFANSLDLRDPSNSKGISSTDPTYLFRNDPVSFKFDNSKAAFDYMKENAGYLSVIFPLANGKVIEQTFKSITVEDAQAEAKLQENPFVGLLQNLFGSKGNPFEGLKERANYTEKLFTDLKPEDTVKVMDSGERGDNFIEIPVEQYKRLKELNMVDECWTCTTREKRAVVHPEDGFDLDKVKEFLATEFPNAA